MTSKWPSTLNGKQFPYALRTYPQRLKLWSVSLYNQPFSRHKLVEKGNKRSMVLDNNDNSSKHIMYDSQVHQITPKSDWIPKSQSYPIYVLLVSPSPRLIQFCSTAICFCVNGKFETNDPKMTLNATRSNIPLYALVPRSRIFCLFHSTDIIFLGVVHRMILKWPITAALEFRRVILRKVHRMTQISLIDKRSKITYILAFWSLYPPPQRVLY